MSSPQLNSNPTATNAHVDSAGLAVVHAAAVDSASSSMTLDTGAATAHGNGANANASHANANGGGAGVPRLAVEPVSPLAVPNALSGSAPSPLKSPVLRFQETNMLSPTRSSPASSFDMNRAAAPSMDLERGETVIIKKPRFKVDNTASYDWSEFYALRGSVVLKTLVPCVIITIWGAAWTTVFMVAGWKIAIQPQLITILSVVLGLLLVFRTNTAYDRYWESRRLWGTVFTHTRNLARFIWVSVATPKSEDLLQKHAVMNLLIAYAVAVKHYLRFEEGHKYEDLHNLLIHLPEYAPGALHPDVDNMPLEISFHISAYISKCRKTDAIDVPTASNMMTALSGLIDCLSNFERVRDSPIPKAYSIHLKQILLIYLAFLPFQIVSALNWVTIPVMLAAAFTLLGIEAIGSEIENPFGYDANDLDIDSFCQKIKGELEQIMSRPTELTPDGWTAPVRLDNFERLVKITKRRETKS